MIPLTSQTSLFKYLFKLYLISWVPPQFSNFFYLFNFLSFHSCIYSHKMLGRCKKNKYIHTYKFKLYIQIRTRCFGNFMPWFCSFKQKLTKEVRVVRVARFQGEKSLLCDKRNCQFKKVFPFTPQFWSFKYQLVVKVARFLLKIPPLWRFII